MQLSAKADKVSKVMIEASKVTIEVGMPISTLSDITQTLLDKAAPTHQLHEALDRFSALCSDITGIIPDPSFDSWAGDSFLDGGVAINPQAAAFCIKDYQRSIVFIRAIYAALLEAQSSAGNTPVSILYAGCGPFATLLLPLLTRFRPEALDIQLLDIHQDSLNSVRKLIAYFGFDHHNIKIVEGDACTYQHDLPLHVIIAETMQKSLEQEPQFAVTANLAPQLTPQGIFIPERIEVSLCLAHLAEEQAIFKVDEEIDHPSRVRSGKRHPIKTLLTLEPGQASTLLTQATKNSNSTIELAPVVVSIPSLENLESYDALLLTTIQVFKQFCLHDYESAITLPYKCHELSPLKKGNTYQVSYQLGKYPRFNFSPMNDAVPPR